MDVKFIYMINRILENNLQIFLVYIINLFIFASSIWNKKVHMLSKPDIKIKKKSYGKHK